MTWNYRVMEFDTGTESAYREIREVYYDKAGQIAFYSGNAATILWDVDEGDSAPTQVLEKMASALTKPVLTEKDFPGLDALPRAVLMSNGKRAEVFPAKDIRGLLYRALDGDYIFRVSTTPGSFIGYTLLHSDMSIKIVDEEAFLYKVDEEFFLDHAPETLGLQDCVPMSPTHAESKPVTPELD